MVEKRSSLVGADRTFFMLVLVPYLMGRGETSLEEIAEHFDVSIDTVRQAVELLPMTGIPGESKSYLANDLFEIDYDALDEGMVSLTRNIVIDETPRFSAREASALIAGLRYLSALPENSDSEAIAALIAKLQRGAADRPAELQVDAGVADASLAGLRASIERGTRVDFDYHAVDGAIERRLVDPLRIESNDRDWYLRGWDRAREAIRTFRLDRIGEVIETDDPISAAAADAVVPETLFQGSADDIDVIIELPETALALLADYAPQPLGGAGEGRVRARLRVAHHHGLKRLVARLAGVVTVIEPAEARRAVADWAAAGAAQYRD